MNRGNLTRPQLALVYQPADVKIFLEGPAGSGKTTASVERLLTMLSSGLRGDSILLLVPQRTLADPYYTALRQPDAAAGGMVSVFTVGGLAQHMVELFWPMMAERAGFAHPDRHPVFLTLETAQYYMAYVVRPLLEQGFFESVNIDRHRLYSQIIDNLNKAAVVHFPFSQIGERLKSAWIGEPAQLRVYDDVQVCADRFRKFCLDHNLLDFSLQIEVFRDYLWPSTQTRAYLLDTYQHLIFDNLEEDSPVAHDLLRAWLPHCQSALLIYDHEAGYRRFLGADPQSAYSLKNLCDQQVAFKDSLVTSEAIHSLSTDLSNSLLGLRLSTRGISATEAPQSPSSIRDQKSIIYSRYPLRYEFHRYYPGMLDWVADQVEKLVLEEGIPPGEIVILAPYLSGALRFSLMEHLEERGIPSRSHRPSRALREEPATQCLLTLAALAYPEWGICPPKFDVAYALMQSVQGMDLVRAQLLTEIVYRQHQGLPGLSSFDMIRPEMQERITYRLGEHFEKLRLWLDSCQEASEEFDHFLSRLFGELLSQPGFGFHGNYDAGQITANLIESVKKFRMIKSGQPDLAGQSSAGSTSNTLEQPLGKEYLLTVQEGLIAAQYLHSWQVRESGAVLLAPAYTFLMSNRSVEVQFWLDVGSRGWSERINQPLTHPHVLSRSWQPGRIWTDADEVAVGQEALHHLILGLLRRCRGRIYLGLSELGEQGYEQRGPLLHAFQRLLREAYETH